MPKGFDPSDIIAILPEKYRNYIGFVVKRGSEAVKYCYLVLETVGPLPQPIFEMFCSSQLYIAAKSSKPGHMGGNEGVERIGDKIAIFRNIHTEYRDIRVIGAIVSVGEFPPFIIFTKQSNHDVLFKTAETIDHEYLSRLLATIWDSIENIVNLKEKADPFKSSTLPEALSRSMPDDKEETPQTSSLHPIERLSPVELGAQLLYMHDLLQYLCLSCSEKARNRFTSPFNADKKSDFEKYNALRERIKRKSWEDQVCNKQSLVSICDEIEAILKGEPFLLIPCFAPPPPTPSMPACSPVPKKARCDKARLRPFNLQTDIRKAVLNKLNAMLRNEKSLLEADIKSVLQEWTPLHQCCKTEKEQLCVRHILTVIEASRDITKSLIYRDEGSLQTQAYEIEASMCKVREYLVPLLKLIDADKDSHSGLSDAISDFHQELAQLDAEDKKKKLPYIKKTTMSILARLPKEHMPVTIITTELKPMSHPVPSHLHKMCEEHFTPFKKGMWQNALAKYANAVLCVEDDVASKMAILKKALSNWEEVCVRDVFGDIGRVIIELFHQDASLVV